MGWGFFYIWLITYYNLCHTSLIILQIVYNKVVFMSDFIVLYWIIEDNSNQSLTAENNKCYIKKHNFATKNHYDNVENIILELKFFSSAA